MLNLEEDVKIRITKYQKKRFETGDSVAIKAKSFYRGCNYTSKTAFHFLLKHFTVETGKNSIKKYRIFPQHLTSSHHPN